MYPTRDPLLYKKCDPLLMSDYRREKMAVFSLHKHACSLFNDELLQLTLLPEPLIDKALRHSAISWQSQWSGTPDSLGRWQP